MGLALKISGQVGRSCPPYAASHSQEMAQHGFLILLAMEVAQERRATSDFQGNAEPDLQVEQREPHMEPRKDSGYASASQLRSTL
jgi:hypothetical protein